MNWLTQAIDPFHDTDIPPTGYPDWSSDASVVGCIERSVSIGAPGGISGTATWDVNICSLPLMAGTYTASAPVNNTPVLRTYVQPTGNLLSAPATGTTWTPTPVGLNPAVDMSTIVYSGVASGNNTFPTASSVITPLSFGFVDAGATWSNGNSRLVAVGFEVANTTAEINKQGSVAYYHCPQSVQTDTIMCPDTTGVLTQTLVQHKIRMPPANLGEAMTLRGSVMREAAEGAYIPVTFSSSVNDFSTAKTAALTLTTTDTNGALLLTTRPSYVLATGTFTADTQIETAPLDTCGAYFSGLSASTTLQLTVRFYVEKVPAPSDSQVVVLTRPACPCDPVALEFYKRIISDMPPGTRLCDNADGDWWNTLLKIAALAAPAIGVIAAPFTGGASIAIGAGIGGALKAAQEYDTSRGKKPEIVHKTPSNGAPSSNRIGQTPPPRPSKPPTAQMVATLKGRGR